MGAQQDGALDGAADGAVSAQARALGDPTRYALFEHVRAARRPLTVAELRGVFPLHPNAIRQHLRTLRQAGLLIESSAPARGRGRPARTFTLSLGAIERWDATGPHEHLAAMLLEVLLTGDDPLAVGAATGERLAAELSAPAPMSAPTPPSRPQAPDPAQPDPHAVLLGVARRLGFDPVVEDPPTGGTARTGRQAAIVLRHCPFAAGAQRAPQIVCRLHRGLADGVCRATGSTLAVTDLVVRDPTAAGCRLVLEATAGDT